MPLSTTAHAFYRLLLDILAPNSSNVSCIVYCSSVPSICVLCIVYCVLCIVHRVVCLASWVLSFPCSLGCSVCSVLFCIVYVALRSFHCVLCSVHSRITALQASAYIVLRSDVLYPFPELHPFQKLPPLRKLHQSNIHYKNCTHFTISIRCCHWSRTVFMFPLVFEV